MKLFYNEDKCPKCGELTDHYIGKCCRACHLTRIKNYNKAHADVVNARAREYYKENTIKCKVNHKEWLKIHASEWNEYQNSQRNESGKTLSSIRMASNQYLFKTLNHTKLENYQIHHCFGYEDHTKFIYIPKSLHLKIHEYLRVNNIDARSNHYKYIRDMINNCTEYTYMHE